ncbi:MAG: hypothetical protein WB592_13980, partial [Acidimicrobiales bacterium]
MTAITSVSLAVALAGTIVGSLKWLRVAQREHYLAGSATRFALRWWQSTPVDAILSLAGVLGIVASAFVAPAAVLPAAVAIAAPRRLGVRGRTSRLVWT